MAGLIERPASQQAQEAADAAASREMSDPESRSLAGFEAGRPGGSRSESRGGDNFLAIRIVLAYYSDNRKENEARVRLSRNPRARRAR